MIVAGDKTIYIPRYASKAHGSSFAGNRNSIQQLQTRSAMNPGPKKRTKPRRRTAEGVRKRRGSADPGPKTGCLRVREMVGGDGEGEEEGKEKVGERRKNPKLRSEYVGEEGGEDMEMSEKSESSRGM